MRANRRNPRAPPPLELVYLPRHQRQEPLEKAARVSRKFSVKWNRNAIKYLKILKDPQCDTEVQKAQQG